MKKDEYDIEYQRLKKELDTWLKTKKLNMALITTTVFVEDEDQNQKLPPHETHNE